MRYDTLIKNLEAIIYNWYEKEDLKLIIQYPFDGLCDNIKPITYGGGVPEECITSWKYYSGDKDYPVGGGEEYVRGCEEPYSLFNNPLRLHLAVHMLQWLRFHNKWVYWQV